MVRVGYQCSISKLVPAVSPSCHWVDALCWLHAMRCCIHPSDIRPKVRYLCVHVRVKTHPNWRTVWFFGFYDIVMCWILKNASHTATSSSCIFAFVSVFNAMAFWAWIKQFSLGLFLRLKLSLLLGTLDIVGSNSSQSHSSRWFQADKVIPVMTLHIVKNRCVRLCVCIDMWYVYVFYTHTHTYIYIFRYIHNYIYIGMHMGRCVGALSSLPAVFCFSNPLRFYLYLPLSLVGCGEPQPTPKPAPSGPGPLKYLGAGCNVLTAEGCNPIQLPMTYLGLSVFSPTGCAWRGVSVECISLQKKGPKMMGCLCLFPLHITMF